MTDELNVEELDQVGGGFMTNMPDAPTLDASTQPPAQAVVVRSFTVTRKLV